MKDVNSTAVNVPRRPNAMFVIKSTHVVVCHWISCWNITFDRWTMIRLIWIGFKKNKNNKQCLFSNLAKDVIKFIESFI